MCNASLCLDPVAWSHELLLPVGSIVCDPITHIPATSCSQAIPEADAVAHIRQPAQRMPTEGGSSDTATVEGVTQQVDDFTFSPVTSSGSGRFDASLPPLGDAGSTAGLLGRTGSGGSLTGQAGSGKLNPDVAPFEPLHGAAFDGESPKPPRSPSPPLLRSASPTPPRSASPPQGMTRSGSNSYLNPEPFEPAPPEPVPFGSPPKLFASEPQAGLYRTPSADDLKPTAAPTAAAAGAAGPDGQPVATLAVGGAEATAGGLPGTLRESFGGHAAADTGPAEPPSSVVAEPATSMENGLAGGSLQGADFAKAPADAAQADAAPQSPTPPPVAADFAPQTPEAPAVEAVAPAPASRNGAQDAAALEAEAAAELETADDHVEEYRPSDEHTPYPVRKLRSLPVRSEALKPTRCQRRKCFPWCRCASSLTHAAQRMSRSVVRQLATAPAPACPCSVSRRGTGIPWRITQRPARALTLRGAVEGEAGRSHG